MSGDSHKVGRRSQHFHAHQLQKAKAHAAFSRVTAKIHQLKIHRTHTKHARELRQLTELIEEALEEAQRRAEQQFAEQRYEILRTVDAVKQQLKNLLDSLPPEYSELSDWEALVKKLAKSGERDDRSSFARGTTMSGKVRAEVHQGEVKRWVSRVDTKVGGISPRVGPARRGSIQDDDGSVDADRDPGGQASGTAELAPVTSDAPAKETEEPGRLTFHNVVDDMRRRKRRGEPVEPADVELVADRAYVLMRELRNELAPSWKPEEVPRWINAGDKYVYDLALAAIPKELFEATNAFQGIQDLRRQQQVFTLRAADQLAEGAKRT